MWEKKWMGAGAAFGSAALLFLAWCALHDMQRSEGIGLYYASVLGQAGASWTGAAVEAGGMLLLLVLLLCPCILFHRRTWGSFLRILTAYLAFMPTISLAYLVHLASGAQQVRCSEALLNGSLGQALLEGVSGAAVMLSAGIPLLLLTAFAIEEGDGERKRKVFRKWIPAAAVWGVLLILAVVFPALKEICTFFVRYLLLLYGFPLWEHLLEVRPQYKSWGWIIFGSFGLRGIYIIAEVMSVYHM